MMAETCYLAESAICYPPLYDELRATTSRPTDTIETVAMAAVGAAIEQDAGAILVLSTSGNTARLISKFRPNVPIITGTLTRSPFPPRSPFPVPRPRRPSPVPSLSLRRVGQWWANMWRGKITVTRNQQTARQIHLHRGCYPFWYPEPRGVPASQWQIDVDNRIRCVVSAPLTLTLMLMCSLPAGDGRYNAIFIRFGLKSALRLKLLKPGSTVIAVQGWKQGSFHTNTMRILTVPVDAADLEITPLSG